MINFQFGSRFPFFFHYIFLALLFSTLFSHFGLSIWALLALPPSHLEMLLFAFSPRRWSIIALPPPPFCLNAFFGLLSGSFFHFLYMESFDHISIPYLTCENKISLIADYIYHIYSINSPRGLYFYRLNSRYGPDRPEIWKFLSVFSDKEGWELLSLKVISDFLMQNSRSL